MAQKDNQPKTFQTPTTGTISGMTNDAPQSAYSQRAMQKPPMANGPMQGAQPVKPANQR